jgi:hypothetical protein
LSDFLSSFVACFISFLFFFFHSLFLYSFVPVFLFFLSSSFLLSSLLGFLCSFFYFQPSLLAPFLRFFVLCFLVPFFVFIFLSFFVSVFLTLPFLDLSYVTSGLLIILQAEPCTHALLVTDCSAWVR